MTLDAVTYASCPRCDREPGESCQNVRTGVELVEPHSERREVLRAARRVAAGLPRRRPEYREADQLGAMLRRMFRAMARRAGEGDLEALAELVELGRQLDEATTAAAVGAHSFGYSWTEIAGRVGITRQGARQRWGATSTTSSTPAGGVAGAVELPLGADNG